MRSRGDHRAPVRPDVYFWRIRHEPPHLSLTSLSPVVSPTAAIGVDGIFRRHKGIANSLDSKLDTVCRALDDFNANNDGAAANALNAFINEVEAQSGGQIPVEDADALIVQALIALDML